MKKIKIAVVDVVVEQIDGLLKTETYYVNSDNILEVESKILSIYGVKGCTSKLVIIESINFEIMSIFNEFPLLLVSLEIVIGDNSNSSYYGSQILASTIQEIYDANLGEIRGINFRPIHYIG